MAKFYLINPTQTGETVPYPIMVTDQGEVFKSNFYRKRFDKVIGFAKKFEAKIDVTFDKVAKRKVKGFYLVVSKGENWVTLDITVGEIIKTK